MVHLQGEWGAGKSSFLNFISNNLSNKDEKWIIVNYNAWQNQHISPPWWTLIDHIYRKSKPQLNRINRFFLSVKENIRRIIWYNGGRKILASLLTIVFAMLIIRYGNSIIEFLSLKTLSSTKELTFNDF